ncbi:MAG: hypothetical protein NT041_01865, partial [Candidatus Vogelbacteria bacterium]|nr:hypothetical protein [Candidatus Vogelbacteria bacterium]
DGLAPVRRYEIISQNLTTATVRVHKSYDETFKNYSNTGDYLKYDNYVDVFLAKESGGWAIDSFRCTAVIMHP